MGSNTMSRFLSLLRLHAIRSSRLPRSVSFAVFLVLAAVVGIFVWGYAVPCSQLFGQVYCDAMTSQKVVALSFDDGPNEPYTSQILDILKASGIKATFFVVGRNVVKYPQVARRIVEEGHVIGNHSYNHDANHALSNGCEKEIALAQTIIATATGVVPHLYRPPHGKKSPWELKCLRDEGLVVVNWSVSTNEQHLLLYFGKPTAGKLARDIINKVKPGKIVLLHDGYGTEHDTQHADKSLTVQVLPIVIKELEAQGYRFVTIPELLGIEPYDNVH